jgi:hypothetical protein
MVESVLPNYWETMSGIPPDSSTWSGGLGLGTLHVGEVLTGRRNSRDTTGEGCKLFCNSCFNKLSVTVTVTVTVYLRLLSVHLCSRCICYVILLFAFNQNRKLACLLDA